MSRKHGMHGTPTYKSWQSMLCRVRGTSTKDRKNYVDRGITVCDEWNLFEAFFADMGVRPERMTLDRIDNDGPYCKENCRWATVKEQNANRRRPEVEGRPPKRFQIRGKRLSLRELSELTGITYATLWARINQQGWPVARAVTEPPRTINAA